MLLASVIKQKCFTEQYPALWRVAFDPYLFERKRQNTGQSETKRQWGVSVVCCDFSLLFLISFILCSKMDAAPFDSVVNITNLSAVQFTEFLWECHCWLVFRTLGHTKSLNWIVKYFLQIKQIMGLLSLHHITWAVWGRFVWILAGSYIHIHSLVYFEHQHIFFHIPVKCYAPVSVSFCIGNILN